MLLLLMAAAAFISDDVSFANLNERQIVQLVTQRGESLYRAVNGVENDRLTVVDISSLEEQTFEKSELKAIRSNVSDRSIAEGIGVGPWLAWQLQPIFEGAGKRQTVAAIQQAAVYVTANPYSGLMIGDVVDVFRLGAPVNDPETGEVLETPEQKIAKLEVISLSEKLVTCRPTGEFVTELKIGDVIRPVQPRTSVAVLPFMNTAGQPVQSGLSLADDTTNAFVNLGIPTLERARTVEILGEQLRQLSLVYEGGDASRVGQLLGAATLVTGRLIEATDKRKVTTLSVRLLDVRTGTILKSLELELNSTKLKLSAVKTFNEPGNLGEKALGFLVETWASGLGDVRGVTVGPGNAFGNDPFVYSVTRRAVLRVTAKNRVETFARGFQPKRSGRIVFDRGDQASGFNGDMFVSAPADHSEIADLIFRVKPNGATSVFHSGPKAMAKGAAFGHGSGFGDFLYVLNPGDKALWRVDAFSVGSAFGASLSGDSWEDDMIFTLGGAFGQNAYITDGVHGKILKMTSGGVTTDFASVPAPMSIVQGEGVFGDFLYVGTFDGSVFRVSPTGEVTPFLTEFGAHSPEGNFRGIDVDADQMWLTTDTGQLLRVTVAPSN